MATDRYLSQFDDLDIATKEDRRMGVLVLHEFCGAVMYEMGVDYLNFGGGFRNRGVREQWDDIKTRLETIGGIDIPEAYSGLGERVYEARTQVMHNKVYDPSRSNLEELRELLPGWREWLADAAISFRNERDALTPYEGVEELIRKNLRIVEQKPLPEHDQVAMETVREMKNEADRLKHEVDELEHHHGNIDQFALLLRKSLNLREDVQRVRYQQSGSGHEDGPKYIGERIDDYL